MGYTTDANYLLQASTDIKEQIASSQQVTAQFEAESATPWHSWGDLYEGFGATYESLRGAALSCLTHAENLLDAYGDELHVVGRHYLLTEESNAQRFHGQEPQ